ncbi:hypothetical protein ABT160_16720 [Streptomyces sp. NPDC001941]|uniref:hypothetical protein n=1 Tax=Streptomyces sp. NPDC001941 TaxID=3154659 RepID=UPI00332FA5A0
MSITKKRVTGLAASAALALASLSLATPASAADAPFLQITPDKATAVPGDTVNVAVKFTNNETTAVQFVWQSFQPSYGTSNAVSLSNLKYTWTGCTTDTGASCTANGSAPGYTAPIAPGQARTFTLTYKVEENSNCGGGMDISFYSYLYYEYAGGTATKDGISNSGNTHVNCPV